MWVYIILFSDVHKKNVFISVYRHLYLASVTYKAGKDKKKFRSHERQKKSPRRYRPIVFFLLSIYLVEVPELDSIISFDQMCVVLPTPKNIFQNKYRVKRKYNNVISCLGTIINYSIWTVVYSALKLEK